MDNLRYCILLTLALAGLKLLGIVFWSWWLIFLPLLLPIGLAVSLLTGFIWTAGVVLLIAVILLYA